MLFFYFECTSSAHRREIEKFFILCTKGRASRLVRVASDSSFFSDETSYLMHDICKPAERMREREPVYIIPHYVWDLVQDSSKSKPTQIYLCLITKPKLTNHYLGVRVLYTSQEEGISRTSKLSSLPGSVGGVIAQSI